MWDRIKTLTGFKKKHPKVLAQTDKEWDKKIQSIKLRETGFQHFLEEKYTHALASFNAANKEDNKYYLNLFLVGATQFKRNNFKESIATFKDVIDLLNSERSITFFSIEYENLIRAYCHLYCGYASFNLELYREAIDEYRLGYKFDPESGFFFSLIGNAYLSLSKQADKTDDSALQEKAHKAFDEAIRISPDVYSGYDWMGYFCYSVNKTDESINNYRKALDLINSSADKKNKLTKEEANINNSIGNAFFKKDTISDYESSIIYYDAAHKLDPENDIFLKNKAGSYNYIGNAYYDKQDFTEAIKNYTEATQLAPDNDIYFSNIASAYEKIFETEPRLQTLENAISYYQKANKILATESYQKSLQQLQSKKKYLSVYGSKTINKIPVVTPIAIEVAANLIPLFESKDGALTDEMQGLITKMREELLSEMGHSQIPGIRVRGNETDLPDGTYIIMLNEIPLVSGNVSLNEVLVNMSPKELNEKNIKGNTAIHPLSGEECAWVPKEHEEFLRNAGYITLNTLEYITVHLSSVIRKNLSEFILIQNVSYSLKDINLYEEVTSSHGGISRFTELLKIFADEEVATKELETICKEYLKLTKEKYKLNEIFELLRAHKNILPGIKVNSDNTRKKVKTQNILELGDKITKLIEQGTKTQNDTCILSLEPHPTQDILSAIRDSLKPFKKESDYPIIRVKDSNIRRPVRKLVEIELPNLYVLHEQEIMLPTNLIATIKLN